MLADCLEQSILPELFAGWTVRFGDTVRINRQEISRSDLRIANRRFPVLKQPENRGDGINVFR